MNAAALLKCISMSNKECRVRLVIVNVKSNELLFHPYSITVSKCSGSCNNINNPYSKLCFPDVIKDMNIKVCNLMSRTNERRYVSWQLVRVNED